MIFFLCPAAKTRVLSYDRRLETFQPLQTGIKISLEKGSLSALHAHQGPEWGAAANNPGFLRIVLNSYTGALHVI